MQPVLLIVSFSLPCHLFLPLSLLIICVVIFSSFLRRLIFCYFYISRFLSPTSFSIIFSFINNFPIPPAFPIPSTVYYFPLSYPPLYYLLTIPLSCLHSLCVLFCPLSRPSLSLGQNFKPHASKEYNFQVLLKKEALSRFFSHTLYRIHYYLPFSLSLYSKLQPPPSYISAPLLLSHPNLLSSVHSPSLLTPLLHYFPLTPSYY